MQDRSLQDLLAERRANCMESMRERDVTARAMLAAHIAEIDREIERRRVAVDDAVKPVEVG